MAKKTTTMETTHKITQLAGRKWAYVTESDGSFEIVLSGFSTADDCRDAIREAGCADHSIEIDYSDEYADISAK